MVWDMFICKTMGEYNDIYMKSDTLLLIDIFESFRDIKIKSHKLDSAHFFTVPVMRWDAMLRFTKVKLKLLNNYNVILKKKITTYKVMVLFELKLIGF